MKNCLSIEQSAELIKRGVTLNENDYEVFDIGELLSLLPKHIRIEHRHYYLRMNTFVLINEENPMWIARYITSNSAITLHERWSEELIDALYKLIISLLDNHVKLD